MAIRELTVHAGLQEKLALLEQEPDRAKAADLFSEAEAMALDALLNDEPLFSDGDRGKWRRAWRALRAKYRPATTLSKPKALRRTN